MDNRPQLNWRAPSRRLLIGAGMGLGAAFAAVLLLEVAYRLAHGIPFTGGTLYQEQLRMPDSVLAERPWYRDFLARFRPSDNPILFYEPRPGYQGSFEGGPGPGAEIQINSQGFRDREYSPEKDAETFRVAVLGDSIIWGHGLTLEDTFAKQLEQLLVEREERKVEVLNFGVSGYSTQQEVELYRVKASRFHPDLVIVGYCLNDYEESSVEGQAFRRLYYDVFTHSYVCENLRRVVCGFFQGLGRSLEDSERQSDLREQFELLQSYCGDKKIVVVIFPELLDFRHYDRLVQHERVVDALKGLDCEILDLLTPFRRFEPEALQLNPRDRTHPNALGIRVAAAATLDLLNREDLIPPVSGRPAR
jgi:lysophospholipase L1-like esterase